MADDAHFEMEHDELDRRTRWASFPDGRDRHLDHSMCTICKQVIRQAAPGAPWTHVNPANHYAERDSTHMWNVDPKPRSGG